MQLSEFEKMVDNHDLTYDDYSDDDSVWLNGHFQYNRIKEAAELFPIEEVKRIWNAAVNRKLIKGVR
jgi:hypothetical protein